MNKIPLFFQGISQIVGEEKMGLLILVDKEEQRQLTIPCEEEMLRQFDLRLPHEQKARSASSSTSPL